MPGSRVPVTFSEANSTELPAGGTVESDWVSFPLQSGRDLTVTFSVLRPGATTLWSDGATLRYESQSASAATAPQWTSVDHTSTYNVYFLSRVETGQ